MSGEMIDPGEVRFFSGSSNPQLAAGIAGYLNVPLDSTDISRFSNDCLYVQLGASVRSRKVFIVQSLSPPVNDHLVELLMMLDIARSAAAQEVHAMIRSLLAERSPELAETTRVLYGGSVKPDNAAGLFAEADIDGALVGGASLKADGFGKIVVSAVQQVEQPSEDEGA